MIEDELIRIWQSSGNREKIKFEKSRLILDLQNSLARLQRSWTYMEWREHFGVLLTIPIFGYKAYFATEILARIGAIWIILSGLYISFRLLRVRKYKPVTYTDKYLDFLLKTKHYLTVQKQLLNTVLYWYFSPLAIGILLVLISTTVSPENLILNIGGVIALGCLVYWLNKRAVRISIVPRIEKIDELLATLQE